MNWITHPVSLVGTHVLLQPLEVTHFETLIHLAKDTRIWQHYAIDGSDTNKLKSSLENALVERENGRQYPFIIILKNDNNIIGSTRFLDIQTEHKKIEIGWTWLHPDYWGTKVNLECKLLLLTYCFEQLKAKRVQLKTDENNIRSRKAIEKIGGLFEGILRNDMIRDNGTNRNSAYYSIIESEWETTSSNLSKLVNQKMI
jgi:RimJ/RimL family protein N-acetyltransferase